jgi:Cytochrome c554 and c-prime
MKTLLRTLVWSLAMTVLTSAASMAYAAGPFAYVGVKKCKACHLKEFNSWAETKMAKSFALLSPGVSADAKKKAKLDPDKNYGADPVCLACHTTGYGKPGGFVSLASTPELAGVQCEMCHGPGGTYTQKEHMSLTNKEYRKADLVKLGLVGEITKSQCENCHNPKSPFFKDFKFEERKAKGTHEKFPLKYKH